MLIVALALFAHFNPNDDIWAATAAAYQKLTVYDYSFRRVVKGQKTESGKLDFHRSGTSTFTWTNGEAITTFKRTGDNDNWSVVTSGRIQPGIDYEANLYFTMLRLPFDLVIPRKDTIAPTWSYSKPEAKNLSDVPCLVLSGECSDRDSSKGQSQLKVWIDARTHFILRVDEQVPVDDHPNQHYLEVTTFRNTAAN